MRFFWRKGYPLCQLIWFHAQVVVKMRLVTFVSVLSTVCKLMSGRIFPAKKCYHVFQLLGDFVAPTWALTLDLHWVTFVPIRYDMIDYHALKS